MRSNIVYQRTGLRGVLSGSRKGLSRAIELESGATVCREKEIEASVRDKKKIKPDTFSIGTT